MTFGLSLTVSEVLAFVCASEMEPFSSLFCVAKIKANSKRQCPTSYSRLIMTFSLSLTVSELLAFVCVPEMTSCLFHARWRRWSNIKADSERPLRTSYSR